MRKRPKLPPKYSKYNLTLEDIAQAFGYSSTNSLQTSSAKDRVVNGVNIIISLVEEALIHKIKE